MKFYKAVLSVSEEGVIVNFIKFVSIHQTEHYYFCVRDDRYDYAKIIIDNDRNKNPVTLLKNNKIGVVKVSKTNSRTIKKSKDEAIDSLVYRTEKRVRYVSIALGMCKLFLKNKDLIMEGRYGEMLVPNTLDFVNENYIFD